VWISRAIPRFRVPKLTLRIATLAVSLIALSAEAYELPATAAEYLADGNPERAFAALAPLEHQFAGIPRYDYLLGLSALQSGRPDAAIFALERLFRHDPAQSEVRSLLAQAYFAVGDIARAKYHLEELRKSKLSEPEDQSLLKFLEVIDLHLKGMDRTKWSVYAAFGAGFDTNANNATDTSTFAVPAFGNLNVTLFPSNVKLSSGLYSTEVGGQLSHRVTSKVHIFAGAVARLENFTADRARFFDKDSYRIGGGMSYALGDNVFSRSVDGHWLTVDNNLFRSSPGVTGQWRRNVSKATQATAFARISAINYHPESQQGVRDTTHMAIGVGGVHRFSVPGDPIVFASVYGGVENNEAGFAAHLGRHFVGGRAGAQYQFSADLSALVSFAVEHSNYGGTEPLFLKSRDDLFLRLHAGLYYKYNKQWTVYPEIRYRNNDSNIVTSDFDSLATTLTVRYEYQ